jgi:hypothetical protein
LQLSVKVNRNVDAKIESYPREVHSRLKELTSPSHPLGAAFITDGKTGTLYLDLKAEMSALVPFLLHELSHSLDHSLWSAARRQLSRFQKNEIIFQAEISAFRDQHRFLSELKKIYPTLADFYSQKYARVLSLQRAFEPSEIALLYRITPS